jgi:RND family efflux transporter MFP subunit
MELVPVASAGVPQPAVSSSTPRAAVQIDLRRQQLVNVRTVRVERRPLVATLRTVGVVRYDETRVTDVNVKVEGWVRDLFVDSTGGHVISGQPLFALYSPELVATQNDYLLALRARDRLRESPLADVRAHAERLVDAARQRLVLWDLPRDQIARIEESREADAALVFRSPVSGYVIDKRVVEGQHVTPGQSLYTIADLSTVWIEADLYEQDLARVRVGTPAIVTLNAYPGERVTARVSFLYPFVGEQSRTAKIRLVLANHGTRVKPGMYANVELRASSGTGLVIPPDALLDSGREQVVFVAQGDGFFEPRPVRVGQRIDDGIEILQGLDEGDVVAAGAAFFLDSESQLRASLQAYEPPPAASAATSEARTPVEIAFRSVPDPPQHGENQLEVVVRSSGGTPVTDAQVTVVFFMAAMPSMNMPAMRSETTLAHAGNGVYRGTGQIPMAGRWDVTIYVVRDGQHVASQQLSVVAR